MGSKIAERLSNDLRKEMPGSKSFSVRNLEHMLRFYRSHPQASIFETSCFKNTLGQIIIITQKIIIYEEKEYYL